MSHHVSDLSCSLYEYDPPPLDRVQYLNNVHFSPHHCTVSTALVVDMILLHILPTMTAMSWYRLYRLDPRSRPMYPPMSEMKLSQSYMRYSSLSSNKPFSIVINIETYWNPPSGPLVNSISIGTLWYLFFLQGAMQPVVLYIPLASMISNASEMLLKCCSCILDLHSLDLAALVLPWIWGLHPSSSSIYLAIEVKLS